ncbi:MAG: hypothetical protein ABSC61_03250 [Anaerolineales bacterium]
MVNKWLEKRNDITLIFLLWLLLFVPYILWGGLLRDDLGYLIYPRGFSNYFLYQAYFSSLESLRARPIYALQLGLCYWFFGTAAWKFHLVNLTLFGGSILFFYLALQRIFSRRFAFFAACAALVYPCAASNLFSSVMTNFNLSGLCWCAALYVTASNERSRGIWTVILFLLSALSYEAFIPLFVIIFFLDPFLQKEGKIDFRQWLRRVLPLGLAFILYLIYRLLLEYVIGTPTYRLAISSPIDILYRYWAGLTGGLHIALIDSLRISLHALRDLPMVSPIQWIVLSIGIGVISMYVYWNIKTQDQDSDQERHYVQGILERFTTIRISGLPYLDICVWSIFAFCCAHTIFALSDYLPTASGFDNRTLGAIRFATAMLAAIIFQILYKIFVDRWAKRVLTFLTLSLFLLFTLSMVGQREAWIAAAHYNEKLLRDVNAAIVASGINEKTSFTLVVEMPDTFPGEVNKEPIYGWPWDIGTALSFSNPGIDINTLVYHPSKTSADEEEIIIDGFYKGVYPFYFYSYKTGKIVSITSEKDWEGATNNSTYTKSFRSPRSDLRLPIDRSVNPDRKSPSFMAKQRCPF